MITLQRYKHFLKKVYTLIRKCIGLTNFSFLKKVYTHFFHNFANKKIIWTVINQKVVEEGKEKVVVEKLQITKRL